jgi:hypothetical protein
LMQMHPSLTTNNVLLQPNEHQEAKKKPKSNAHI